MGVARYLGALFAIVIANYVVVYVIAHDINVSFLVFTLVFMALGIPPVRDLAKLEKSPAVRERFSDCIDVISVLLLTLMFMLFLPWMKTVWYWHLKKIDILPFEVQITTTITLGFVNLAALALREYALQAVHGAPKTQHTVTVKAIHDNDLVPILGKLGLLEPILRGEAKCFFCGTTVTLENIGAIFKHEGKIRVTCDNPRCLYRAAVLKSGQQMESGQG